MTDMVVNQLFGGVPTDITTLGHIFLIRWEATNTNC